MLFPTTSIMKFATCCPSQCCVCGKFSGAGCGQQSRALTDQRSDASQYKENLQNLVLFLALKSQTLWIGTYTVNGKWKVLIS